MACLKVPRDRETAYEIRIRRHPEERSAPFLTLLCRHHRGRAKLYRSHLESVEAQLESFDRGLEHLTITGATSVSEANHLLGNPRITRHLRGRYVMVLDDDDVFADPRAVRRLWDFVVPFPAIPWIMIKARISDRPGQTFPYPWGRDWRPRRGTIPSFSMVVKRQEYLRAQRAWCSAKAADWRFAQSLWSHGLRPRFLDTDHPLVHTLVVSHGKGERHAHSTRRA